MINKHLASQQDSPFTNSCLFTLDRLPLYCCYAETSSSAVRKRRSKVYEKPIAPYSISPWYNLYVYCTARSSSWLDVGPVLEMNLTVESRLQKLKSQSDAGKFCAQLMRELLLVGTQLGYLKERIKQKIKSIHAKF